MWPSVIRKLTTTNTNAPVMTTALHYLQAKKRDDLPRQVVNLLLYGDPLCSEHTSQVESKPHGPSFFLLS